MKGLPLSRIQDHLNQPALIFSFFMLGLIGHLISWGLLAWAGEDFLTANSGPGRSLAALHSLTGLTLMPVIFGSSIQILPVISQNRPFPAPIGWLILALLLIGQLGMLQGILFAQMALFGLGAAVTAVSCLVFATLIGPLLVMGDFRNFPEIRLGASAGLVCLLIGLVMGGLLGLNYQFGWLGRPDLMGTNHGILMVFGFVGSLVVGFSPFFMQMITMTRADKPPTRLSIALLLPILLLALFGVGAQQHLFIQAALAGGLLLSALQLVQMEHLIAQKMSRTSDVNITFFRISWFSLPIAFGVAFAGQLLPIEWLEERWLPIFMLLTLHGWLLSLVIGVVGRILPFLAGMYLIHVFGRPIAITQLEEHRLFRAMRWPHALALACGILAVIHQKQEAVWLAGLFGMISAILLLVFAVVIIRRAARLVRTLPA